MDTKIYRAFFGPFIESRTTNHYNLPCHNIICLEKLSEVSKNWYTENDTEMKELEAFPFSKRFPYVTDSCTVLYPGYSVVDHAFDFVFKKILWNEKLTYYVPTKYKRGLKRFGKETFLKEEVNRETKRFLNWLKHDPAEDFVGDYNWLYTGGNITGFNYGNGYCLIAPDEYKKSTFLNIIKLNSEFNPKWKKNMRPKKFYMSKNEPVYQITSRINCDNIFLALRQRKLISIQKFGLDCGVVDVCSHTIKINGSHKKFLTTCDLSQDSRYVVQVDNDGQMTVHDIESNSSIFSCKESCNVMSWSRVLFNAGESEVYFANQQYFKIFDFRADSQPKLIYSPDAVTNPCERICNYFKSKSREHVMYIATSHNLIEIDVRSGKNLQRWTHMMKFAPQFGEITESEDKELIILQSGNSRELIGILNEGLKDDFPYSQSCPYLFSTLKEEMANANFNGYGLHHKINERIEFKITGLHVAKSPTSKAAGHIFTVNGGGDVVLTNLRKSKDDEEENERKYEINRDTALGIQHLESRCYSAQTKSKKSLVTTSEVYDVGPLLSAMKNPAPKMLNSKRKAKPISHYWPISGMYSPESLSYRQGYLAEKILPHWGIKRKFYGSEESDDEEKEKELEELRAKVTDWMETVEK